MKNKFKDFFVQLFCTKLGLLLVTLLLALGFGLLSTYYFWAEIAMYVSLIYPVALLLIMIAYAWVINPVREYKENKKLKNGK